MTQNPRGAVKKDGHLPLFAEPVEVNLPWQKAPSKRTIASVFRIRIAVPDNFWQCRREDYRNDSRPGNFQSDLAEGAWLLQQSSRQETTQRHYLAVLSGCRTLPRPSRRSIS